ncbi:dienelactone hydrolase family protein [Fluoribacter dumoffii]|uniref:Putative hydrolase n=1 Tax=Fluoribacter dumoffii TaxID=463 RepID=A0A377G645_9GAMM|nr:dienelactone hydrolase family protein [Fluoribacter dumoffii]KTC92502.1 dienelactone hydrolase [Fluoribacter dumoffii NY 23]MCW8387078.1 dienelactone hydrolase family protein [Fluoribacter dumoffii]MCW8417418.1 dienelactone hydrolase family protein [Fluoribacter dumoffii]MCW8454741.1 dienelactone hydrolase family protein [Fluoribacter dumoffii]MCW8461182.1 dienelactone hydrolase family protein [Fluoribacter dumoffii]
MHTSNHIYHDNGQELNGFMAYDESLVGSRPAVLVVHDWSGRNEFACEKAKLLAQLGYVGFAVDMYGHAQLGSTVEEKQALMNPLVADQSLLRRRIQAGLAAACSLSEVDSKRVAIIGFCFGGMCALELARSGAELKGVVSFHGLLHKPGELKSAPIKAKILALHGYDDPMVQPDTVHAFCKEMTEAHVDWQMHMYGHVQHAFTNPLAHDLKLGTVYNEIAAERSWQAMTHFLQEIFSK